MDRITEKDLTTQMSRELDRLQMEWYYLGLRLQEVIDMEMRKKARNYGK